MPYFALIYEGAPDYLERRPLYREAHLRLAHEAKARGELILGGAFADPVDGALLIFRAAHIQVVENFVRNDPYVLNGLVTRWRVRPWTVVIEEASAIPGANR